MSPNLAMALLFEALGAWGPDRPQSSSECIRFVRGPLMEVLVPRLGPSEAASVGGRIVQMLTHLASSPPPTSTGAKARELLSAAAGERDTTPMPTWQMPVMVVVASGKWLFADRLTAALGAHRVATLVADDAGKLARACRPYAPGVIVIDGEDPPAIVPEKLVTALAGLPVTVLRTVWADQTDYGQRVLATAERAGIGITPLGGRDSILPLCDIVRSLRRE